MHAAFDCLLPPGVASITLCVHGWVEGVCVGVGGPCINFSLFDLSIQPHTYVRVCVLSIYLSIYLPIYLSIYLSIYLPIYQNIINLFIQPSTIEGSTIQKAISSPSEVRAGWNCLVAGSGRREVSSHTPTAVPAAMAAPRTVISQKSGSTVCICVCV